MVKVSFIIPVFNCKDSISGCVAHIERLHFPSYEIILVDDGSTDGSGKVCDHLADCNSHVFCVHKVNGGASAARNAGMGKATGEYYFFVDADDYVLPIDMAKTLKWLDDKVDCICYGMDFCYFWNRIQVRRDELQYVTDMVIRREDLSGQFLEELFYLNYITPVWNKLIRSEVVRKNGISFSEDLTNYEDLVFALQLFSKCESIAICSESIYQYNNTYGKDNTYTRIARMDNLWQKTDIIADAFYLISEKVKDSDGNIERILANIYLETLRFKLVSCSLKDGLVICKKLSEDVYFKKCLNNNNIQGRMINCIRDRAYTRIWVYVKYRNLRSFFVQWIRLVYYLLKSRKVD